MAFANEGVLFEAMGEPRKAAECYERALRIVGENQPALKAMLARVSAAAESADAPPWAAGLHRGDEAWRRGDYTGARAMYVAALAQAPGNPDAAAKALLRDAHYNLACILSLSSVGKDGPKAEAKPISTDDASHLRERAFRELRAAIDLGYADARHLSEDADLAPLHDDPRWAELLRQIDGAQRK